MRLHVDALPVDETLITLNADRSHYLCRVRRARAGDPVTLFDGNGARIEGEVHTPDKRTATVRVVERHYDAPPAVRLSLAIAWIKGEACDRAVQKAVELGANDIVLMTTERSNVRLNAERRAKRLEHLRRISISACEQCGQNHVPGVRHSPSLTQALDAAPAQVLCLQPDSPALPTAVAYADTLLLVGPEGGWSEGEQSLLESRATMMGLGALILRAETAPLAALAAIRSGWGWRP